MKYLGENAVKKLIALVKGDLATKQDSITASGLLKGDGTGTVTAADTQEATLVDVPSGLLKGDGTSISAAVAGTDYQAPLSAATATPLVDGTAAVGTSEKYAREDHVHPSDSTKLSLSGGTMTGSLTLSGAPASDLMAATKKYVDDNSATALSDTTITTVWNSVTV